MVSACLGGLGSSSSSIIAFATCYLSNRALQANTHIHLSLWWPFARGKRKKKKGCSECFFFFFRESFSPRKGLGAHMCLTLDNYVLRKPRSIPALKHACEHQLSKPNVTNHYHLWSKNIQSSDFGRGMSSTYGVIFSTIRVWQMVRIMTTFMRTYSRNYLQMLAFSIQLDEAHRGTQVTLYRRESNDILKGP